MKRVRGGEGVGATKSSGRSEIALGVRKAGDLLKHHGRLVQPAVIGFLMERSANPPTLALLCLPRRRCTASAGFFFFFSLQIALSLAVTLSILREGEGARASICIFLLALR